VNARPPTSPLRLVVLGAGGAFRDGTPLDLGGRRQRGVLALLIAARGQIVSADRLINLVWRDEPPARASGVLQAYVSHLRRALEPDRPARDRTGLIVSAAPGYGLRAEAVSVDAWQFEEAVRRWASPDAEPGAAMDGLTRALRLWRGTPYGDHPDEPWALAEHARLDELRLAALEALCRAQLHLGAAHAVVADAETLLIENPLREEAWRLLVLALYRSGRQGDALAALRRARAVLTDTLGVDPGPALRGLEADVLAQAPHLLVEPTVTPLAAPALVTSAPVTSAPVTSTPVTSAPSGAPIPIAVPLGPALFGREREERVLLAAADRAQSGATVVLLEGPAGSGKSALVEALAGYLGRQGWATAWGRCPEVDGAPALYPWAELLRILPPGPHEPALDPLMSEDAEPDHGALGNGALDNGTDPAARRFRLHRAFARRLRAAAADTALLVVLDDVHRADEASLALLRDLLPDLRTAPVLLVAAYRPEETHAGLTEVLGALARQDPVRLEVGPLPADAVEELLCALADRPLDAAELRAAVLRSDGNPFHVTELGRLLASGGPVDQVPSGVRHVVKRRTSRLPDQTLTILRVAAVLGRNVSTEVLLRASGLAEDDALDAIETALVAGFLQADGADLRFSHVLVRDALYEELSPPRRTRLHRLLATTLESVDPHAVFALAYHHHLAGPGHAAPAARWAALAAEQAERRQAHVEAAALWRRAADSAYAAAQPAADRLALLLRLIRALAWCGDVAQVRTVRAEAIDLARESGDERLLLAALTAWQVPMPWTQRRYLQVDRILIDLAERALEATADDRPDLRCRLLCLLVGELDGEGDPRTAARAAEAVAAAEQTQDPQLLTLALNAQLRACYEHNDLRGRLAVAYRVAELGDRADLPATSLLGHQAALAAHAGLGELSEARAHLAALEALAARHHMGTGAMMALCAHIMLRSIEGDSEAARRAVGDLVVATRAGGELSGDSLGALCLFCLDEVAGAVHDADQVRRWYVALPRLSTEFLVRALLSQERDAEARRVWRPADPVREDYLSLVIWALRAHNALILGDADVQATCTAALAPYEDQLIGASSGALSLEPVAELLARLATARGDTAAAAEHWQRALELSVRSDAGRFAERARAGLAALAAKGV
jgi:DNA-binding SARP family transcriptional activator